MTDRYDVEGNSEGQYQPGSDGRVLLNKLKITEPAQMDEVELSLLNDMEHRLLEEVETEQRLTVADLCNWHAAWLGEVYGWAGRFRTLNLAKEGYTFAAAQQIPRLMSDFERNYLSVYTPCHNMDEAQLIEALGICHIEFIIIHPFREGNGRLSRVLATMMALQAGMPPLDFSWFAENRDSYVAAIHHGHMGNYEPIKQAFSEALRASMTGA